MAKTGRKKFLWPILFALAAISSCGPVISEGVRQQASLGLTFEEVFQDPKKHLGRVVIFSGVILEGVNTKDGTLLTVLHLPAGPGGRPKDADKSAGRFLALDSRYLDVAIYSRGRAVTVAGEVAGRRILPLGEIQYKYPLLKVKELYLWPKKQPSMSGFDYYYHPFHSNPIWWTF